MKKVKKREIDCPHSDCFFYSSENVPQNGDWKLIAYCSHPNNDLIENGKSCNLYRVDWAKQLHKIHRSNPVDRVKLERQTLLKLLHSGLGNLSPDERDATLGLVEQLKQQEERLAKLADVQSEIDNLSTEDPFVIEEPESFEPVETMEQHKKIEPVDIEPETVVEPDPPKEELPEDVVRRFIESWNKQSFEDEYECLGDPLRVIPMNDYIHSRQFAYADAKKLSKNGNLPLQELGKIYSIKIDRDTARVICDKIEKYSRYPKTYQQKIILEKVNGSWKIINVQTRER